MPACMNIWVIWKDVVHFPYSTVLLTKSSNETAEEGILHSLHKTPWKMAFLQVNDQGPLWKLSRETPCSYSKLTGQRERYGSDPLSQKGPKEFCSDFPKSPCLPSSREAARYPAGSFWSCQELSRAEGYQRNTNKLHLASEEVRITKCSLAASTIRPFETTCQLALFQLLHLERVFLLVALLYSEYFS